MGTNNLFGDLSYFDQIFSVTLHPYLVENHEQLHQAVDEAVEARCDVIIGGNIVVEYCQALGVKALFLSSTRLSVRNAIHMAQQVYEASELQKKDVAQLRAILDYSFNGILKIDPQGGILFANDNAAKLLGAKKEAVIGWDVFSFFAPEDRRHIEEVLAKKEDLLFVYAQVNGTPVYYNIAPILVDGRLDSAILYLNEVQAVNKMKMDLQNADAERQARRAYIGSGAAVREIQEKILRLAKTELPVAVMGEMGTGKERVALELHQNSKHSLESFRILHCGRLSAVQQTELLSGDQARYLMQGNYGTLYVKGLEELCKQGQWLLTELIGAKRLTVENKAVNIRVVASARVSSLAELLRQGTLLPELYYLLCNQQIVLEPLRRRREAIPVLMEAELKRCYEKYGKYVVVSDAVKKELQSHNWYGNETELNAFCEALVVQATSRRVSLEQVRQMLERQMLAQQIAAGQDPWEPAGGARGKELELRRLLKEHKGSRKEVAAELGISTTTLWRMMKRYGIDREE